MALARAVDRAERDPALPSTVVRRIRAVEIKARILADNALLGTYRSVFRGSGLEFEEVREYEPGDDIRSIDWNVTARMGTPYIKKFREDRELNIFLAVDASASSWFGSAAQSKRDLGAEVAALLALTAMTNNDRVGLLRFASGMQEWLPSRRGREHLLRVIRELLYAPPRRVRTELSAAGPSCRRSWPSSTPGRSGREKNARPSACPRARSTDPVGERRLRRRPGERRGDRRPRQDQRRRSHRARGHRRCRAGLPGVRPDDRTRDRVLRSRADAGRAEDDARLAGALHLPLRDHRVDRR